MVTSHNFKTTLQDMVINPGIQENCFHKRLMITSPEFPLHFQELFLLYFLGKKHTNTGRGNLLFD